MTQGETAGLITAVFGGLALLGKGIAWFFSSRAKRELWVEKLVRQHTAKLEGRVATLEREKADLVGGFLMLAGEVHRLDPSSDVLKQAHRLFVRAFPVPNGPAPDSIADLLDELHFKTGGKDVD